MGITRSTSSDFLVFTHVCPLSTARPDFGTVGPTKTDEFSEKFQTAFDAPLPPSFSENYIADFATKVRDFATKVCIFILAGLLNII